MSKNQVRMFVWCVWIRSAVPCSGVLCKSASRCAEGAVLRECRAYVIRLMLRRDPQITMQPYSSLPSTSPVWIQLTTGHQGDGAWRVRAHKLTYTNTHTEKHSNKGWPFQLFCLLEYSPNKSFEYLSTLEFESLHSAWLW